MRFSAYYDFYTDRIRPLQLIVRLDPDELDWTKTLYITVDGPFERLEPEDFGDMLCATVLLSDLTLGTSSGQIGINLPAIAGRHGIAAELLILLMDDVEEVMKLSL
ncbi:hypothetical protein M5X02_14250 [Paenibacillus alvei]|uniref:hypothetical protein n=1 Tax=Paenibacillus alvei TaxID=44250 RepID=UPI002284B03B|nr:hypothetical protein [Paenibacillus alvei]MCY9541809.1 hypothetical protein [Paenibacillus alvei]MEC0082494.1 hypothetical protein [Paenibacillus alvei]